MWLEFEKQPLRWSVFYFIDDNYFYVSCLIIILITFALFHRHLPVGLLYDLLVSNNELPWQITVHFDKYPDTKLLKCPNK